MEKQLRKGSEFEIIDLDGDIIGSVEFRYEPLNQWANGFKIWFNGSIIHSSKTFKSMEKRLSELTKNWGVSINPTI